jgi:hypothetical protein
VIRFDNFSPFGLLLEAHCDFCKDEVAQRNSKFWATFLLGQFTFLHSHLNKQFKNMASCRYFKIQKLFDVEVLDFEIAI